MNGRAASVNSTNGNNDDVVIWVKKPVSNSSREIRDEILRGVGYVESEIAEFDRLKPGYFYINDSRNTKEWASTSQVKEWKSNIKGEVPITMSKKLIEDLIQFHRDFITGKINNAILGITNSELRSKVFQYLWEMLTDLTGKRMIAADNLMLVINGNPEFSERISLAISQLTQRDGYADNPFLILANAKAEATKYSTKIGPGYDGAAKLLLSEAARVTANNYNFKTYTHLSAYMRREEAGYLNSRISQIYSQIGANQESGKREWLARFYGITETERSQLEAGDIIQIIPPGVQVVRTPSPLEKELDKLKDERRKQIKLEEELDKGKQVVETTDPESGDSLEIRGQTRISTEVKGSSSPYRQKKDAFPRGQNQNRIPPGKIVSNLYGESLNKTGVIRMNRRAGFLDILIKLANAKTFMDRMEAITKYLAEKERLERLIRNEREYIVPPKPADLKRWLNELEKNGRLINNPYDKYRINTTLDKLNRLSEESHAFWGR